MPVTSHICSQSGVFDCGATQNGQCMTSRAIRKHWIHLRSYRSRGTLMSYTDHSVQRRLKSNAPNESAQLTHISTSAIQI